MFCKPFFKEVITLTRAGFFVFLISMMGLGCSRAIDGNSSNTAGPPNGEAEGEGLMNVVRHFYNHLSNAGTQDLDAETKTYMDDNWQSTPTPLGGPGRAGFVKTLAAFHQLIPDLKWNVKEMLVDGDQVIVRSMATGTPNGPFLGVEPATGKSFSIMTIDIHTLKEGKMVRSFHIEDWATAIQQLKGVDVSDLDTEAGLYEDDGIPRTEAIDIVKKFYTSLSNAGDPNIDASTEAYMDEQWKSTPQPLGGPGRSGFVKTLGAFHQLIPDLKWEVKDMLVSGNRVAVRSIASGTPQGPFLGVEPPTGKSFEVMTIDIHTLKDGKMVRSFHVEDWATAVQQLIAK